MKYDERACKFNMDTGCVELRQYVDFHQMMLAIYPSSPLSKIKSA